MTSVDPFASRVTSQKELACGHANFYTQPAPELARILARLEAFGELLLECYARWDAFDSRAVDVPR